MSANEMLLEECLSWHLSVDTLNYVWLAIKLANDLHFEWLSKALYFPLQSDAIIILRRHSWNSKLKQNVAELHLLVIISQRNAHVDDGVGEWNVCKKSSMPTAVAPLNRQHFQRDFIANYIFTHSVRCIFSCVKCYILPCKGKSCLASVWCPNIPSLSVPRCRADYCPLRHSTLSNQGLGWRSLYWHNLPLPRQ